MENKYIIGIKKTEPGYFDHGDKFEPCWIFLKRGSDGHPYFFNGYNYSMEFNSPNEAKDYASEIIKNMIYDLDKCDISTLSVFEVSCNHFDYVNNMK